MLKKNKKGWIIIISGPTGVGETSVTKGLLKILPKTERLVTTTSRRKRKNEINGLDYHFISKKEFQKRIKEGYFLEYTHIKNRDDYYGTFRPDIDKKINQGINLILNLDAIGTKAMKKNFKNVITIFLLPDKFSNLIKRIKQRDPNISPAMLRKRIINAQNEIKKEKKYYQYKIINVQNKLSETIQKTAQLIKQRIKQG